MSVESTTTEACNQLYAKIELIEQQRTLIAALKDQLIRLQSEMMKLEKENAHLNKQFGRVNAENDALKQKVKLISENNQSLLHSFQIFQRELIKRQYNSLFHRTTIDIRPNPFFVDLLQNLKNKLTSISPQPAKVPNKSEISQLYEYFFDKKQQNSQIQLLNETLEEGRRSPRVSKIRSFGKRNLFSENYRQVFWFHAIENKLHLTSKYYEFIRDELNKCKKQNKKLNSVMQQDLRRMDVKLNIQQGKVVLERIEECLQLFEIYRPDVGYVQGMTYFAWMFAIRMVSEESFICFSNVMLTDPFISGLYTFKKEKIQEIIGFFEQCLIDKKPKLLRHMKQVGVQWDLFLIEWAYTFFARAFSLRVTSKIWDLWFTEGYNVFFKVCTVVIEMLQAQIYERKQNDEIIEVIRSGTHKLEEETFMRLLTKQKLHRDLRLQSI